MTAIRIVKDPKSRKWRVYAGSLRYSAEYVSNNRPDWQYTKIGSADSLEKAQAIAEQYIAAQPAPKTKNPARMSKTPRKHLGSA